jgi:hypothetical protein
VKGKTILNAAGLDTTKEALRRELPGSALRVFDRHLAAMIDEAIERFAA